MSAPPLVDISAYLKPLPVPQVPVLDESVWKKSEDLTSAFRELQTSKAIDLGYGVQLIPASWNLLEDMRGASFHLVTRKEQRDVIDYAYQMSRENLSKQEFIVAVRGSPGIGKSRSSYRLSTISMVW